MPNLLILLCFLIATTITYCVDPSQDFNITDFAGTWNVSGIFSTQNLSLSFYSCSSLDVALGSLNKLTLTLGYIETKNNKYIQSVRTLVPSPLNKAILISTTSPSQENNFVVTYYDTKNGEAIIINPAVTFGYILSKNSNPAYNGLQARAIKIFKSLNASLNNVTFLFNNNCDSRNLNTLQSFDPKVLSNQFYGNAIYTTIGFLQDAKCFTVKSTPNLPLLSLYANITFNNGKVIVTSAKYLSSPQQPSVLINTQIRNLSPFVLIYSDLATSTFVAATGDSTRAFIFSKQTSLSQNILSQVKQALIQNGMIVDNNNFYLLNATCPLNNDLNQIVY